MLDQLGYAALSGVLGFSAGATEIISRYRDAPAVALLNRRGLLYSLTNAVISIAAYLLLRQYSDQLIPAIKGDDLATSLVAGFGAMALARAKPFTISSGGTDTAVGPDAALSSFLSSVDRAIDRDRSTARQELVFSKIKDLDGAKLGGDWEQVKGFLLASIPSFQNLEDRERADLADTINTLANPQDARLRLMAL